MAAFPVPKRSNQHTGIIKHQSRNNTNSFCIEYLTRTIALWYSARELNPHSTRISAIFLSEYVGAGRGFEPRIFSSWGWRDSLFSIPRCITLIRPTAQHGLISAPVLSVAFGVLPYTHRTHLVWSHRTESNREPADLSINVQLLPPLPFVTVFPIHSLLQRKLLWFDHFGERQIAKFC